MSIIPPDRSTRQTLRLGLLFASPFLAGFLLFTVYPLLANLGWPSLRLPASAGGGLMANPSSWAESNIALARVGAAFISFFPALLLAAVAVPVTMLVGLGLALLLDRPWRGIAFYRAAILLPALLPGIALALLWHPLVPRSNRVDYRQILDATIVLPMLWGAGVNMIVYLAALRRVPRDLYEAADVEGASAWQRTVHVTLPALAPVFLFTAVVSFFGGFLALARPWVFAGPVDGIYPGTFIMPYILGVAHGFFKIPLGGLLIVVLAIFLGTAAALSRSGKRITHSR